ADPAMPAGIYNRAADNWRPSLSLADLAGDEWPDRARKAAIELASAGDASASAKVLLLGDLRDLFDQKSKETLFTHEKHAALQNDEAGPWPEWKSGKPITGRQLAALLREFDIKPKTVRRGVETDKGYKREWFEDAFARYLPPRSVTPSQSSDLAGFEPDR